ncbi:hypothetical protein PIB30_104275, partial [Stylosanthes scabra]|nr:hypothetical protein [Stylosanthes scabra]
NTTRQNLLQFIGDKEAEQQLGQPHSAATVAKLLGNRAAFRNPRREAVNKRSTASTLQKIKGTKPRMRTPYQR